jgi:hypothetical protein
VDRLTIAPVAIMSELGDDVCETAERLALDTVVKVLIVA